MEFTIARGEKVFIPSRKHIMMVYNVEIEGTTKQPKSRLKMITGDCIDVLESYKEVRQTIRQATR